MSFILDFAASVMKLASSFARHIFTFFARVLSVFSPRSPHTLSNCLIEYFFVFIFGVFAGARTFCDRHLNAFFPWHVLHFMHIFAFIVAKAGFPSQTLDPGLCWLMYARHVQPLVSCGIPSLLCPALYLPVLSYWVLLLRVFTFTQCKSWLNLFCILIRLHAKST